MGQMELKCGRKMIGWLETTKFQCWGLLFLPYKQSTTDEPTWISLIYIFVHKNFIGKLRFVHRLSDISSI